MPIDRDTWHRLVPQKTTFNLPCPACTKGKLKLDADGIRMAETQASKDFRNDPSWDPDNLIERWSARVVCDEGPCGEIVHLIGDTQTVETDFEDDDGRFYSGALEDVLRVRAAYPAPPMFRISRNVPRNVIRELELAFQLYWADTSACVARLRTAVEEMLDHQRVPKERQVTRQNGVVEMRRMDLYQRIQAFTTGSAHEDQLQGLRNIGNLGTHGSDDVDEDDLFDALEVIEFALNGIYDTRTINAKADRLKRKKPGH